MFWINLKSPICSRLAFQQSWDSSDKKWRPTLTTDVRYVHFAFVYLWSWYFRGCFMHLSSYILCICIHLMTICLELFRLKASSTLRNFFGTVFVCNCPKRVACWQLNFSSCRASWWNRSSSIAKWLTSLRPFTGDTCDAHKRQMEGNHWYSHTNMHTATKIITLATQKTLFSSH